MDCPRRSEKCTCLPTVSPGSPDPAGSLMWSPIKKSLPIPVVFMPCPSAQVSVSVFSDFTFLLLPQCPLTVGQAAPPCSPRGTRPLSNCSPRGQPQHVPSHCTHRAPFCSAAVLWLGAAILQGAITHNVFVCPCLCLMAFCDGVMPPVISDTANIGHQGKLPCLSALEWCYVITILLSLNTLGCNVPADVLWEGDDISGKVMTCDWLPIWTTNTCIEKNSYL